jgi:hypothetical protein
MVSLGFTFHMCIHIHISRDKSTKGCPPDSLSLPGRHYGLPQPSITSTSAPRGESTRPCTPDPRGQACAKGREQMLRRADFFWQLALTAAWTARIRTRLSISYHDHGKHAAACPAARPIPSSCSPTSGSPAKGPQFELLAVSASGVGASLFLSSPSHLFPLALTKALAGIMGLYAEILVP